MKIAWELDYLKVFSELKGVFLAISPELYGLLLDFLIYGYSVKTETLYDFYLAVLSQPASQ